MALKSCTKSNNLPNLVTLNVASKHFIGPLSTCFKRAFFQIVLRIKKHFPVGSQKIIFTFFVKWCSWFTICGICIWLPLKTIDRKMLKAFCNDGWDSTCESSKSEATNLPCSPQLWTRSRVGRRMIYIL